MSSCVSCHKYISSAKYQTCYECRNYTPDKKQCKQCKYHKLKPDSQYEVCYDCVNVLKRVNKTKYEKIMSELKMKSNRTVDKSNYSPCERCNELLIKLVDGKKTYKYCYPCVMLRKMEMIPCETCESGRLYHPENGKYMECFDCNRTRREVRTLGTNFQITNYPMPNFQMLLEGY